MRELAALAECLVDFKDLLLRTASQFSCAYLTLSRKYRSGMRFSGLSKPQ
jgi:hypothetical protein